MLFHSVNKVQATRQGTFCFLSNPPKTCRILKSQRQMSEFWLLVCIVIGRVFLPEALINITLCGYSEQLQLQWANASGCETLIQELCTLTSRSPRLLREIGSVLYRRIGRHMLLSLLNGPHEPVRWKHGLKGFILLHVSWLLPYIVISWIETDVSLRQAENKWKI